MVKCSDSARKAVYRQPAAPKPKPTYVYTLNLNGGNKYVGTTQNPQQRMAQHFSGNGAKWTQKHAPISVNSLQMVPKGNAHAKKVEKLITNNMCNYHGNDKVRGAGHTKAT